MVTRCVRNLIHRTFRTDDFQIRELNYNNLDVLNRIIPDYQTNILVVGGFSKLVSPLSNVREQITVHSAMEFLLIPADNIDFRLYGSFIPILVNISKNLENFKEKILKTPS